jgi:pimeloyl-ACP methyl ester carboxylesterase
MNKLLILCSLLLSFFTADGQQQVQSIIVDGKDSISGYYLTIPPESGDIRGVVVLLPGFGQRAESVLPETKLHTTARDNGLLTIIWAAGPKLYADQPVQAKLTAVLEHVVNRYKVDREDFILGGYSAGGAIALRYTELCRQFPEKFPIQPKAVFMVDSPIDIFVTWDMLDDARKYRYSEIAAAEGDWATTVIRNDYGVPGENVATYAAINAFNMNKAYGENEQYLKDVAVRAYHDVDIAWRLVNRNQTVHNSNYEVTSELINRLLLLGNKKAEFMQSFRTGYRSNGQRHPHSWSIVDEKEWMQWAERILH